MAFQVGCENCQSSFSVKDEFEGKTAKCPKCASPLTLVRASVDATSPSQTNPTRETTAAAPNGESRAAPKSAAAAATKPPVRRRKIPVAAVAHASETPSVIPATPIRSPQEQQVLQNEILSAFESQIEPTRPPLVYRLGVFLAALTMIMLPIIYLGLIVLTTFLVYWHMTNNIGILAYGRGRAKFISVMAYLAPLIGGVTLVTVMVKPFFAKVIAPPPRRSLTEENEPILFAFVRRICEAVRAPIPKRIDVDCDVNASASFRRGALSMITGNDLVLTIGMPLVAGMNMRQFGGVLAHEFGHFSQGAGMRLSYVVRVISMWFTRVVYSRDEWDDSLHKAAGSIDIRIGWVFFVAIFCVWLTRNILWVLMMVGHLVSSFLLRQMEFDADRFEARLAGSDNFESTCHRIREVGVAYQSSVNSLQNFMADGKLGDNLPRLLASRLGHITPEISETLRTQESESKTGWLDTHPSDAERIASAHKEAAAGIFQLERPAADLFCNYDALSENVTWDLYRHNLGPAVKKDDLHPVEDVIRRDDVLREAMGLVDRYFLGCYQPTRPLPFPTRSIGRPRDAAAIFEKLRAARSVMKTSHVSYKEAYKKFAEFDEKRASARLAIELHRVNIKPPSELPGKGMEESQQYRREAEQNMAKWVPSMQSTEKAAAERFEYALTLSAVADVQERMQDAETMREQAVADFTMLCGLRSPEQLENLAKLRDEYLAFGILLAQLGDFQHEKFVRNVLIGSRDLCRRLAALQKYLSEVPYPFAEGKAMSVGEFLIPGVPDEEHVGEVYEIAGQCIERHGALMNRLVSRLTKIADEVEVAIGLPRLTIDES